VVDRGPGSARLDPAAFDALAAHLDRAADEGLRRIEARTAVLDDVSAHRTEIDEAWRSPPGRALAGELSVYLREQREAEPRASDAFRALRSLAADARRIGRTIAEIEVHEKSWNQQLVANWSEWQDRTTTALAAHLPGGEDTRNREITEQYQEQTRITEDASRRREAALRQWHDVCGGVALALDVATDVLNRLAPRCPDSLLPPATPAPSDPPEYRPWWQRWFVDPLVDQAYRDANMVRVLFSPESIRAIGETAAGLGLMYLGAGGEAGGVALDATGIGAVIGVPLNIVSAGAIGGGAVLTSKGLIDFYSAMADGDYNAWGRDKRKGPQPHQPREADPVGDENYGGHAEAKHVGRSDGQLGDRLAKEPETPTASTYENATDAKRFSQQVIDTRKQQISNWLKSNPTKPQGFQLENTGEPTGRSLSRADWQQGNGARRVVGARVVLKADPAAPGGYFILTSFPIG
jgi:hypothetical protein